MADQEWQVLPDGRVVSIHDDDTLPLLAGLGEARIERASRVEPDGVRWGVWTAGGDDTGARFATRAEALAWERERVWDLVIL